MNDTMNDFSFGSGFQFSGATIDNLEASEYTLVTIALDESGSISGFESQIEDMLKAAVGACFSSPYSNNLLIRVIRFGSQYKHQNGNGVDEIHGFKPLSEIDVNAYPNLRGGGATPLNDGVYSSVGAMNQYAESLVDLDFAVNGITFVISDGGENASVATAKMVKDELKKSVTGEVMESHLSILIGINIVTDDMRKRNPTYAKQIEAKVEQDLENFQRDAGMSQFIWAGEATKSKLAKLAEFVSQSISSTSQALGTGGPSQNISATI
ncbi:MAG: hypothetical protein H6782_01360 [Candidatus Nomurabacteria bacterium]|nr:MAG: hypothetical protein H6782_01360 [Candidatus Nomurabacteria bacterium]